MKNPTRFLKENKLPVHELAEKEVSSMGKKKHRENSDEGNDICRLRVGKQLLPCIRPF